MSMYNENENSAIVEYEQEAESYDESDEVEYNEDFWDKTADCIANGISNCFGALADAINDLAMTISSW